MATTTITEEVGHDLCVRLRSARLAAGLSRAALAGRADCSLASVANLEAGYIPKRSDVLPRILAVLQNDVERPASRSSATTMEGSHDARRIEA